MNRSIHNQGAYTLIEITVVIGVLLGLTGIIGLSATQYQEYRDGKAAAEALRSVKNAQRLFLADHPFADISSISEDDLRPYLPNEQVPSLPSVAGVQPTLSVTKFPPVAELGGKTHDPSGSSTDGIWDSGK